MTSTEPITGSTARSTICRLHMPCWIPGVCSMWASCAIRPSEKALKGCFVTRKQEEELPYIHKLMRLANLCGLSAEMNEEQLNLLDMLSPLNIEARYPLQKDRLLASLTVSRCEQMIQETEVLYQWIRKKC